MDKLLRKVCIFLIITGLMLSYASFHKRMNQNRRMNYKWLKTYAEYILDSIDTAQYKHYMTCYLDDDKIPELCLLVGGARCNVAVILTQHNGVVNALYCDIHFEYIQGKGRIMWQVLSLDRTLRH